MSKTEKTIKNEVRSATDDSTAKDVSARIAESAYFKAESRGFSPGYELDDWLEAEQELQMESGEAT